MQWWFHSVPNADPLQTYNQLTTPTNCGPSKLRTRVLQDPLNAALISLCGSISVTFAPVCQCSFEMRTERINLRPSKSHVCLIFSYVNIKCSQTATPD